MAKKKKNRKSKKKKSSVKIKKRNPYALGLALRNGSGFHSRKKYNRNIEKRKQNKESEQE